MNYDNPAARLLALLRRGKGLAASTKCRTVWEELLDVQGDSPLPMARLGKAMELSQETILALKEEYPEQGDTWSHWEGQVNTAFMVQNMHGNWETFIGHIDPHTLTYLSMSASLLQAKANTKLIADGDLGNIKKELEGILEELLRSDHPDEIKRYVARTLRRIITSIDEYRLTGALPLLDSIDTTFGHAALDKQYKSFLTDSELGKRLLDTLASAANVVTVAVGIPQLTQAIALLGG